MKSRKTQKLVQYAYTIYITHCVIQKTRKVTGTIYSKTLHNLGAVLKKVSYARMVLMRKSKLSYKKKSVLEF